MVPALAALLTAVSAGAQNAQLDGLLVTASQFTPVDMMKYSQNNYSFTTGRVAAMGGAFTALGGDMASMGINPAGLGMYRNSVWGLSPAMTFTGNRNAYATAHDNNASRFSFNNIGTVLQLSQRSNGLVSFNLGLSYNKMEDFNYRGSVRLPAAAGGSLLNIFQLQLNGHFFIFIAFFFTHGNPPVMFIGCNSTLFLYYNRLRIFLQCLFLLRLPTIIK